MVKNFFCQQKKYICLTKQLVIVFLLFCMVDCLLVVFFQDNIHNYIKNYGIFLLCLFLYLLLGATLPLITHKQIKNYKNEIIPANQILGNEICTEKVFSIESNLEALVWRLQLIQEAKHNIVYSTMSFRIDNSGMDIIAAFLAAAERGVKICLIVDGLNSTGFLRSKAVKVLLNNENITIKAYNPLNILKPWRSQARLHDKYLLIDDKMYILGGRNTNDLFLGNYGGRQNIDREVLVWNSVINSGSLLSLKNYFRKMWKSDFCEIVLSKKFRSYEKEKMILHHRYKELQKAYPEAFEKKDYEKITYKTKKITFLCNSILPYKKEPLLWKNLKNIMLSGSDILIQTPYLILSKDMHRDLCDLTARENLNVRVITNAVETGANVWGCSEYLNNKKKILQTGIAIYECVSRDSCHSKSIMIDKRISLVGSFNFDIRSCYLDTELMLAVDCEQLNRQLRENAQTGIEKSRFFTINGMEGVGSLYENVPISPSKYLMYFLMRLIIRPIRFLL